MDRKFDSEFSQQPEVVWWAVEQKFVEEYNCRPRMISNAIIKKIMVKVESSEDIDRAEKIDIIARVEYLSILINLFEKNKEKLMKFDGYWAIKKLNEQRIENLEYTRELLNKIGGSID